MELEVEINKAIDEVGDIKAKLSVSGLVENKRTYRTINSYKVWRDYVDRFMFNAEVLREDDLIVVCSSDKIIAEYRISTKTGFVKENRRQEWLWAMLSQWDTSGMSIPGDLRQPRGER